MCTWLYMSFLIFTLLHLLIPRQWLNKLEKLPSSHHFICWCSSWSKWWVKQKTETRGGLNIVNLDTWLKSNINGLQQCHSSPQPQNQLVLAKRHFTLNMPSPCHQPDGVSATTCYGRLSKQLGKPPRPVLPPKKHQLPDGRRRGAGGPSRRGRGTG